MAATTFFGWTKPTVGASSGSWGTELNTLADDADADLQAVKVTADAALARAGGTMTGNVKVFTETYTAVNLGNITGTVDIDLSDANFFYGTMTGNVTLTFSNPPATGTAIAFMIELAQDGTGGRTLTLPASVRQGDDMASASTTASDVNTYAFYSRDGGTRYRGGCILAGMSA
jgi:hypothetical protein